MSQHKPEDLFGRELCTKVIYAALSKCPVAKNEVILGDDATGLSVTWQSCRDIGTIDLKLVPNTDGCLYTVEASLIAIFVMNHVANGEPVPTSLGL